MRVHSHPGDNILDYFADSGTTGEFAIRMGRSATLVDNNLEAIRVIHRWFAFANSSFHSTRRPKAIRDPEVVILATYSRPLELDYCGKTDKDWIESRH